MKKNTKIIYKMPALCGLAFLLSMMIGCSSNTLHAIQWVGSFFIDSVTIGAVRVEYYIDSYKAGMDANNHFRDVVLDYYNYSMDTKTLSYVTRLESGLTSFFGASGSIRYKKPWLAYTCEQGQMQLTLYNVLTANKTVVMKGGSSIAQYFSETCKYLLINDGGSYSVYNISVDSLYKPLTMISQYYEALYVDEATDRVFTNFFSDGTRWFNLKTGLFDSVAGKTTEIGILKRVIDNGNVFLFNVDGRTRYCFLNDILSDTVVFHDPGLTFTIDDMDLSTGNVCGVPSGNLTIGNNLGKFKTEIVSNTIWEEK